MDQEIQNSSPESLNENKNSPEPADKTNSARVRKMRGWLGIKSATHSSGYYDDSGSVSYGDGHSGWNR